MYMYVYVHTRTLYTDMYAILHALDMYVYVRMCTYI